MTPAPKPQGSQIIWVIIVIILVFIVCYAAGGA